MDELSCLRMIFNVPYEGLIYVDKDGIIQMVNDAFCRYLSLEREQLIGAHINAYKIDPGLIETINRQRPDTLAFYPKPRLIASRQPVFDYHGQIAGAIGRYLALDVDCIHKNIMDADEYIDLLSRVKTRDIMVNVNQLLIELNSYKEEFQKANSTSVGVQNIKGVSPIISALKEMVIWIGASPSSVLITGESGTGKELFAQAIHYHGERSSRPFVKVNCAAIPETLLESELFGYDEGAFTGAKKGGKMGKFELANHGTIFLDEIGDMTLPMQAKLLRVLQEKEIERVGGEKTVKVDVRVISATNQDLKQLINQGQFRPDLYYRLNVVSIHIPPLRQRPDDIPVITEHLLQVLNVKLQQSVQTISPAAMQLLLAYDWPGNVRELMNVLETAMNFCRTRQLDVEDLPLYLRARFTTPNPVPESDNLKGRLAQVEKARIISALESCAGDRKKASATLGVSRTTLYRMMKKHGLL